MLHCKGVLSVFFCQCKMLYGCSFTMRELCKQENVLSVVVSDQLVVGKFAL